MRHEVKYSEKRYNFLTFLLFMLTKRKKAAPTECGPMITALPVSWTG